MPKIRVLIVAAIGCASILLLTLPASADCQPNDPNCRIGPAQSRQVNPGPDTASGSNTELSDPGSPTTADMGVPPGLASSAFVEVQPLSQANTPSFETLDLRMRYQDPSDVSCGVQALGMALDGLSGGAPTSAALLSLLQENGMMYSFGTGVQELAYAAQSLGYEGSYSFEGWGIGDLSRRAGSRTPGGGLAWLQRGRRARPLCHGHRHLSRRPVGLLQRPDPWQAGGLNTRVHAIVGIAGLRWGIGPQRSSSLCARLPTVGGAGRRLDGADKHNALGASAHGNWRPAGQGSARVLKAKAGASAPARVATNIATAQICFSAPGIETAASTKRSISDKIYSQRPFRWSIRGPLRWYHQGRDFHSGPTTQSPTGPAHGLRPRTALED